MDTVDNNINYWLVGASYGSNDDQTACFVREGIWKNGYEDRYHDKVNQIKPGDKIGIKAAYVRTRGDFLPFDNKGLHVSTMKIKAVGTVKENLGDGQTLKVDWEKTNLDKEWYLYTAQGTVWKLRKDDWRARNLIEFTFYDKPQKIDKLRNSSYFVERFGDQSAIDKSRFTWTEFYEQVATALLRYKYDRSILVNSIIEINNKTGLIGHLNDQYNADY